MKHLLFILLVMPVFANAQIITTFAGNGAIGSSGDGGLATNAQLAYPGGINLDNNGNLLICEEGNVRLVNSLTNVISTIAGGQTTVIGNGGLATNASISPAGVCVDAMGNLYIGDGTHYEVRMVNILTDTISAYVGTGSGGFSGDNGPATSATLSTGSIGCIDTIRKYLYISDEFNYRVRKVDMVTGIITTVAGTGINGYSGDGILATNAQLSRPTATCTDYSGNLYIGDWDNARVRRVDIITGIITTVVGNGSPGYSGDGGPATNAKIHRPNGLCLDKCDNLYLSDGIPDSNGHVIRKVDALTGIITTIAGNGTTGFSGDGGSATNASLSRPLGICFDSFGNLYIADFDNQRVRKITYDTLCDGTINTSGVKNVFLRDNTAIYPNPANDILHMDNVEVQADYRILSIVGTVLQTGSLKAGSNGIPVGTLPVGMYMVEVTANDGQRTIKKIIKQ